MRPFMTFLLAVVPSLAGATPDHATLAAGMDNDVDIESTWSRSLLSQSVAFETGTAVESAVPAPMLATVVDPSPYLGADLTQPGTSLSFGGVEEVADPDSYPARVATRLSMDFNGNGYSCSGTLIDSMHVLTAAHCIYSHDEGGWADDTWVTPGGGAYGRARAVRYFTYEGWTVYENSGYDIAVVELDRPIGALTGWHGYGTRRCTSMIGDTMFNYSFPGEGPLAGEMAFWDGSFDWCPLAHLMQGNDTAYQGQSGSGFYTIDGGQRHVRSVTSHRYNIWPQGFRAVRIWRGAFDYIQGIIGSRRPDQADLIPIGLEVDRYELTPAVDGRLDLSFVIHNYSEDAYAGWTSFDVVLSTNDTISDNDVLVGTYRRYLGIQGMSALEIDETVYLPEVLGRGSTAERYIGIVLNTNDADVSNNATLAPDTPLLTLHDAEESVEVDRFDAGDGSWWTTQDLPVDFRITNTGELPTGDWEGRFYLTDTVDFDADAIEIGVGSAPSLDAGESYADADVIDLTGVPSGRWYVHVEVTTDAGTTDRMTDPDPISIRWAPEGLQGPLTNLRMDYVGFVPGTYAASDTLPVSFAVTNTSTPSGAWTAEFYASTTPDLSGTVHHLASGGAGGLASGETYNDFVDVPLTGLTGGAYYLVVVVDVPDEHTDSDNMMASPYTFDVEFGLTWSL